MTLNTPETPAVVPSAHSPRLLEGSVAALSPPQAGDGRAGFVGLLVACGHLFARHRRHETDHLQVQGPHLLSRLGLFQPQWENPIFYTDQFRNIYPGNLEKKDPDSWAIWPLVYQDPYRRVRDGEWPDQPGNPSGDRGPARTGYNLFGTISRGSTSSPNMVHGTTHRAVGWVRLDGHRRLIGITVGRAGRISGRLGGYAAQPHHRSRDVHSVAGADPRPAGHSREANHLAHDGGHWLSPAGPASPD